MKKLTGILMTSIALTACGNQTNPNADKEVSDSKLSAQATITAWNCTKSSVTQSGNNLCWKEVYFSKIRMTLASDTTWIHMYPMGRPQEEEVCGPFNGSNFDPSYDCYNPFPGQKVHISFQIGGYWWDYPTATALIYN